MIVTCVFHSFFHSLARSRYLSFFSHSFSFILWSAGTAKSTISTMTMHQSKTPSLSQTIWSRWASRHFLSLAIVQTLLPVTFGYSLSSKAVVMRQLRRWKRLWRRSLTRLHKWIYMGPSRSCWNGTTGVLQPEEVTSKGTSISCVYYQ